MGFIIANDYVTMMNVETVLLLAGKLVNLGTYLATVVYYSQTIFFMIYNSLPDIHPCTRTCHAPSLCPETEPCESLITLTCPCNRIRQSVLCGRTINSQRTTTTTTTTGSSSSSSSSSGHHHAATPKCNNDCQTAKRNARLADALGISQDNINSSNSKSVVYSDELVGFARGNLKFLGLVEKTFAE